MNGSAGIRSATVVALMLGVVQPATAQDMQEKVAAAKQAAAANQQALRSYAWVEKTEISLKGEVKNTVLKSCRYGPDGQLQKTPLSEPPEKPADTGRGLRGKMKASAVAKKTGELKAEMQAAAALVQQYVPPAPEKIQAAMAAGKLSLVPSPGVTTLRIADYVKAGDALVLTLDSAAKGIKGINVDSWLESPEEKVTLNVEMRPLPDGTSYAGLILLSIPGSKVDVRITNLDHAKLAQ